MLTKDKIQTIIDICKEATSSELKAIEGYLWDMRYELDKKEKDTLATMMSEVK